MLIQIARISFDKLKKLKELLDLGALTQEEFDEKKKELMNKCNYEKTNKFVYWNYDFNCFCRNHNFTIENN